MVSCPELSYHISPELPLVYPYDALFPLSTIKFEGYEFSAPHDPHRILTIQYGDYMTFPSDGAVHHAGEKFSSDDSAPDFDAILTELEAAERFFTSQI